MENENIIVEAVNNEDGTQTLVPVTVEPDEVNQTDVIPEEETEASDGKLGLAVLALGGAAIAGVTAVIVKKIKNKKAAKEAQNPDGDAKPEKTKKGKRVTVVTKGRKLTLAERLHGCELNPVEEPEKDAPAEEDEAE